MKTKNGIPFIIALDTKEMPGKVVATRVVLDKAVFNMDDELRVDLCDHPLYKQLEAYVKANPSC